MHDQAGVEIMVLSLSKLNRNSFTVTFVDYCYELLVNAIWIFFGIRPHYDVQPSCGCMIRLE